MPGGMQACRWNRGPKPLEQQPSKLPPWRTLQLVLLLLSSRGAQRRGICIFWLCIPSQARDMQFAQY
jgi:hypothetical protein